MSVWQRYSTRVARRRDLRKEKSVGTSGDRDNRPRGEEENGGSARYRLSAVEFLSATVEPINFLGGWLLGMIRAGGVAAVQKLPASYEF